MMFIILLWLAFLIVLEVKNENTVKQREKIIDAIAKWGLHTGGLELAVVYWDSMESYAETVFRLWDWGYERIVPKNVYDTIKPFIE